jgi:hypothetical protein
MVDNPASFPELASALPPDSKSVLTFLKALLGPISICEVRGVFVVRESSIHTDIGTISCHSSSKAMAGTCRATFHARKRLDRDGSDTCTKVPD